MRLVGLLLKLEWVWATFFIPFDMRCGVWDPESLCKFFFLFYPRLISNINIIIKRASSELSFFTEHSFLQQRPSSRAHPGIPQTSTPNAHLHPPTTGTATSRPLSSADESGPVAKRLRSQIDGGTGVGNVVPGGGTTVGESVKTTTRAGAGAGVGEGSVVNVNGNNNLTAVKKPRVRQALVYANIVPSGRGSGSSSRSGSGGSNNGGGGGSGKSGNANVQASGLGVVRRSSRLLSGGGVGGGGGGGAVKVGLKVCGFIC